jgi:hypothetical protein
MVAGASPSVARAAERRDYACEARETETNDVARFGPVRPPQLAAWIRMNTVDFQRKYNSNDDRGHASTANFLSFLVEPASVGGLVHFGRVPRFS